MSWPSKPSISLAPKAGRHPRLTEVSVNDARPGDRLVLQPPAEQNARAGISRTRAAQRFAPTPGPASLVVVISGEMPVSLCSISLGSQSRAPKTSLARTRRVGKGLGLGASVRAALSIDAERFAPGPRTCFTVYFVLPVGHAVGRPCCFFLPSSLLLFPLLPSPPSLGGPSPLSCDCDGGSRTWGRRDAKRVARVWLQCHASQ